MEKYMEKSSVEIAKYTGLSFTTINLILCRSEFNKNKCGRKYKITLDFIDDLYKIFNYRRIDKISTEDKYKNAQLKLMQWKKTLKHKDFSKK